MRWNGASGGITKEREASSNRRELLSVFCLILLGLGLRFYALGTPSLWLDEAISANVAARSVTEYLQWARDDFHPPLYYLLLHFWSSLGHDEYTLRLFSVMTNCITGIILYFGVRSTFSRSTALLTLLLFTLSPFQVRYSQEVRMYSLLGLWIASVLFFTFRYLNRPGWPSLIGYVLSSALGLYTHYHAGVFWVVLNVAVVTWLYRKERTYLWLWLSAQGIVFLLFTPWLSLFFYRFTGGGLSWFPFRPSLPLFFSPLFAFLWGDLSLSRAKHLLEPFLFGAGQVGGVILAVLVLALLSVLWMFWKKRKAWSENCNSILLLFFWLMGTVGLSYGLSFESNIYTPKYLFGASFVLYVLVASLLSFLTRVRQKVGVGVGVLVVGLQVLMLTVYYQPQNHRENWRGAVAHIEKESKSNQVVGFHFDRPMAPYVYYARTSIPALGFLNGNTLSLSLDAVFKDRCDGIWLFDYLAEVYDPAGLVKRTLSERGYAPVWSHNFSGVPLTLWR